MWLTDVEFAMYLATRNDVFNKVFNRLTTKWVARRMLRLIDIYFGVD